MVFVTMANTFFAIFPTTELSATKCLAKCEMPVTYYLLLDVLNFFLS